MKGNAKRDLSNMYPAIAGVIPDVILNMVNIIAIVIPLTSGLKRGINHEWKRGLMKLNRIIIMTKHRPAIMKLFEIAITMNAALDTAWIESTTAGV